MTTNTHNRARIAGVVILLLASACDGTMSPIEEIDGGGDFADVPSGFCTEEPLSCEDLISEHGDALEDCCFGDVRYWCQNGVLFFAECPKGCSYDAEVGAIECLQSTTSGSGSSSGEHGGGWQDPPTDPGPGF